MRTFIALLRGINVGEHKKIKMENLRMLIESLGFKNVHTYIQSGNVVFNSVNKSKDPIALEINKQLINDYTFDVLVIVVTAQDIQMVINNNPFKEKEPKHLLVSFLSVSFHSDSHDSLNAVKKEDEAYYIDGNVVYLYLPNGSASTKLTNNYIEKSPQATATTRNWRTVNKLNEMASGVA